MAKYSIGVHFGALSVRAVLVDISGGEIAAQAEYVYPHKIMETLPDGTPLAPHGAFAHPGDYMEGLQSVVSKLAKKAAKEEIVSLGLDAASCSVLPLSAGGVPLCFSEEFASHPHAYIKLPMHRTCAPCAARLQQIAHQRSEKFLSDLGGTITADAFFPKVLETYEQDRAVFDGTAVFVEVAEWMTLILTGKLIASESMACFRRFYHPFRGYPAKDYFEAVASGFGAVLGKLKGKMLPVGACVGTLHERTAEILGLSPHVKVVTPQIDTHAAMAAVGGKNGDLLTVTDGESVSLLCSHSDTGLAGIHSSSAHCFLPDAYGHEGGQPSVGDTLAHFADHFLPKEYYKKAKEAEKNIHPYLTDLAGRCKAGQSGLLALDWNGGVRTPLLEDSLGSAMLGITNRTRPEEIYRALLEAAAYGARRIKELYEDHGHKITRIFVAGRMVRENKLFCQILADVYACDIQVCNTEDICALGSAIQGAFALEEARPERVVADMCSKEMEPYYPDFLERDIYDALYKEYLRLAETMGGYDSVMKRVTAIKENTK